MGYEQRAVNALEDVLQRAVRARTADDVKRDVIVTLDNTDLLVRWLPVGWPRQVRESANEHPQPDVLVAPRMSPGARLAAREAGMGWADESGAADIHITKPGGPLIIIETKGNPPMPLDARVGWKPATLAVCEALLSGRAKPTVSSIEENVGISTGSAVSALKFLDDSGHLSSPVARGPRAARQITNADELLDAYAIAAERLRSPISIRVGVLWRDPVVGALQLGGRFDDEGLAWGVTSALSASQLAPVQTEIAPLEIYVQGKTWSDLRRASVAVNLKEIEGGRLVLRPFPTPAGATLTQPINGLMSMLWPRVYADLRTTGVRGEDTADHLREEMQQ